MLAAQNFTRMILRKSSLLLQSQKKNSSHVRQTISRIILDISPTPSIQRATAPTYHNSKNGVLNEFRRLVEILKTHSYPQRRSPKPLSHRPSSTSATDKNPSPAKINQIRVNKDGTSTLTRVSYLYDQNLEWRV